MKKVNPSPYRGGWRVQIQCNGKRASKVFDTRDAAVQWGEWQQSLMRDNRSSKSLLERLAYADTSLLTSIPKRVLKAMGQVPYKLPAILDAAIPIKSHMGIYFLISDEEVVYVGQSADILNRISKHRKTGKEFDSFAYIECDKDKLDRLEATYIDALVPVLNWTLGNPVTCD